VRPFLTLFAISLLALTGLAGLLRSFDNRAEAVPTSGDARAEESPILDDTLSPGPAPRPDPSGIIDRSKAPGPPAGKRPPFALHPADADAVTWEQLGADGRAELAAIQQWAELDHGREVHEAWRDATASAVSRFNAARAARTVGLEGTVYVGVLP
jgi:hypothetical protein